MQDVSNFLSQKTNLSLNPEKKMSNGAYVLNIADSSLRSLSKISSAQFNKQLQAKLDQLKKDPNIKYADLNGYAYMQKIPTDSRYNEQWHYYETEGGANLPEAWDITTGSDIVVGVVDTGIVQHEELKNKILPGKNFVSNDEKNEKDDPTDHGGQTSFHGTHVAGTIAALAEHNNDTGVVSGVSWGAKILPARVLGSDGSGKPSDIIEGIRWVAGLGEKSAPTPAKVINLSLGGFGQCSGAMQETIDELNKKGITMVVAAGNSNLPASFFVPANCKGVVSVAAVNRNGEKAYYSNYGKKAVTIAAPGGERKKKTDPDTNMVLSLAGPGEYQFLQGTSMASPHVAGIIALMYTLNPDLTSDQVIKYLQKGARGTVMDVGIIDAKKTLELVKAGPLPKEPKEDPKDQLKDEPAEEPEEL